MNLPSNGGKSVIDCMAGAQGASDFGDAASAHTELMENIVEADEELMEAYLGGEEISAEKLATVLPKAMVEGTLIPVLFTAARDSLGVPELMDVVARYFPAPGDVPGTAVRSGSEEDAAVVAIAPDGDKPFIGQAFKITADPFVGKLAWIRILQGTVSPETTYALRGEKKAAKVGHLFKIQGKETHEIKKAIPGDIIALAKVEEIQGGDVLHAEATPMYRRQLDFPTPMYSLAVTPKSRGDETKISGALSRLAEEDPTFVFIRDSRTSETVISGIGDLHLRLQLDKMKRRFDLEVETKPPKIPYLETITAKADGHHRHKKQTGGAGQFGEVYLRVEPLPRGSGFVFEEALFGESIPRQYVPAIE
jgi:elongation factor G